MPARFEHVEHSLDLDEALPLQRAERPARVVTGLLIFGTVTLSALGLLGDGKLSKATVVQDGVSLEYTRVLRVGKETALELALVAGTEVAIPLDYFENLKLEQIVPEPLGVRISDAGVTYLFESSQPLTLRIYLTPEQGGLTTTTLHVDGRPFAIRQLTLP